MLLAGGSEQTDALPPAPFSVANDMLSITLGQYSSAGAKAENQDFHGALQPEGADLVTKGIAVCLADGISTSTLGATAAETAVKSFLTDYYCTSEGWSARKSGECVIAATNSWMYAQNCRNSIGPLTDQDREQGLVCTFSAMIFKSRTAHIFHVGDGRIARVAADHVEPLTEPHRISLGGGESYLGRALGVNRHVEIDYRQIPLEPGMVFILSTDGVHDHVSDKRILKIVARSPSLEEAACAIAQAALDGGSNDNLTVQLLQVKSLPKGEIGDLIGRQATLPPAPQLRSGIEFAGYSILREIHSGSRSHVYLARDLADERKVALKVPATETAQDHATIAALMLEEWVMRRVDNPHLLKAARLHGPRSHAFSASEYVEGQTLYGWMHDHPQPELERARDLIRQIAAGLLALHRREMIHRDLRPHNVLVDPDGTAKIIDFGSVQVAGLEDLASTHAEGAAYAGTMQYSAPELYLGYPASVRSDLFSLGVIAYQMLTGALPYGPRVAAANTPAAQRRLRYVAASELNPVVPDWMDAALAKAVAIDPAKRYDELSEFIYDLAHPNPALHGVEPRPLLQRGSVRVWQAISAALALALLVLLLTRPGEADLRPANQQEIAP